MRKRTVWAGTEVECALAAVQHARRAPQKGFERAASSGNHGSLQCVTNGPAIAPGARDHLPIGA
jgi:hypothetical protein